MKDLFYALSAVVCGLGMLIALIAQSSELFTMCFVSMLLCVLVCYIKVVED